MNANEIIQQLDLKPHPEGGFYRESYRSPQSIPGLARVFSTGIYYLLVPGAVSKFHRLKHDEMFHFYLGDPVTWVWLTPEGVKKLILGSRLDQGQVVQMVIPGGTWFGGYLSEGGSYGLMGTTVAPGFEFEDFVLAKQEELLASFPGAREEILRLT